MAEFFNGWLEDWSAWFALACILAGIELMTGTYYLLALAGGALLTSFAAGLLEIGIGAQLVVFAVGSVLTYAALTPLRKHKGAKTDGQAHMIGEEVTVTETVDLKGRCTYKGVSWIAKARAPIHKGEKGIIESVQGSTLVITKKALSNEE